MSIFRITIDLLPQHYRKAHSRFRGNTVMFIPITAVLPSRLSPLLPLPRENISVCPHYRGITADYRGITVVPITVQLSNTQNDVTRTFLT